MKDEKIKSKASPVYLPAEAGHEFYLKYIK